MFSFALSSIPEEKDKGLYAPSQAFRNYQSRWGANLDEMVRAADKLDNLINALMMVALVAYFAVKMRGGTPARWLDLSAKGLTILGSGLTLLRFFGGVEKLVTGKIAKEDKYGNGELWKKRNMVKVAADIMLLLARIAVFVFILERLNVLKVCNHAKWLEPTMYSLFTAATIACLGASFHEMALKNRCKKGRLDFSTDCVNLLTLGADVGLAGMETPFGLALGVISAVGNAFIFLKEFSEKHKATQLPSPKKGGRALLPSA